ncbi:Pepco domain-containing protein [Kordiimonas gwangyangensis]|uniref:Pepco domain-containing protein n=1 Tax=Kordiimonas gwangyangensis TaxID=288022 RepID=UPI000378039E|nr:hypothetical protein [Kordiimonas gwangyangensis]
MSEQATSDDTLSFVPAVAVQKARHVRSAEEGAELQAGTPFLDRVTEKISVSALESNLQDVSDKLARAVEGIRSSPVGKLKLDTVSVGLSLGGGGSIMIASVEAGASFTLTFKVDDD